MWGRYWGRVTYLRSPVAVRLARLGASVKAGGAKVWSTAGYLTLQTVKNTEQQRLCHHGGEYKKWWEWSDCLSIIWIDTWCPMLLIKDHWMRWYCEDLQIILRDKSVKSPGGKQDHNGLRSASQAQEEMKQWSQSLIECRSRVCGDLRDLGNSH